MEANYQSDREKLVIETETTREVWEKPEVSELGSLAKDTEGEFNFLSDANQLT